LTLTVAVLAVGPGVCADGVAPVYTDHARLLVVRDARGAERPVRTPADWAVRRGHVLTAMQQVMGPLPSADKKVPLDPRVVEETPGDGYVRKKLTIAVEAGDRLPLYLLIPKRPAGKLPAVLCLHPTNRPLGKGVVVGLGGKADRDYAVQLAERGYVTLAPDYVNMGEYHFDPYAHGYASATMKGVWNHMRCVDLLRSLPEVDGERIGVIGHSLGGHNGMFLAAFDERVKCVVSSCGFCSFPRYMKGDLTGWSHDGYIPRIRTAYGRDPAKMPFDFPEVVAALAPRPFLACAPVGDTNFDVQGVKDCLAAAQPVYDLLRAGDRLRGVYPDAGHDFPPEAQRAACHWLDHWLKPH
jgi:pimeloyl-ACP methyl ester carboxylesterase